MPHKYFKTRHYCIKCCIIAHSPERLSGLGMYCQASAPQVDTREPSRAVSLIVEVTRVGGEGANAFAEAEHVFCGACGARFGHLCDMEGACAAHLGEAVLGRAGFGLFELLGDWCGRCHSNRVVLRSLLAGLSSLSRVPARGPRRPLALPEKFRASLEVRRRSSRLCPVVAPWP